MAGERSEAATPRRLQRLRGEGRVARSTDLTTALGLLAAFVLLQQMAAGAAGQLQRFMQQCFLDLAKPALLETNTAGLGHETMALLVSMLGPFFLLLPALALAANVGQVGLHLSGRGAAPDFNRVNPFSGLSRLFSLRGLVELLKTVLKIVLLGAIIVRVLLDSLPDVVALGGADLGATMPRLWSIALQVGFKAGVALLALAALDYAYQRWDFLRNARMTRQEVKEEVREMEGSPQIRARIRQLQRRLARGRMMQNVPTATVILTNPTHLAVALVYRDQMPAPEVVAKGADRVAERIKAIAREHGVPVIENKPLAQALFRSVEVGMTIPVELFQAVAEVLAYLYTLRQRTVRTYQPYGTAAALSPAPEAAGG